MKIRLIELFAGIGSQTEALKRIGADYESVGMVEIDPYCVTAYNAIHGTDYKPTDITKLTELPECDLLTYSFPCTDISTAGKQAGFTEGSGTRSALVWEVLRLLKAYEARGGTPPKYLLMENVKALVQKKFRPLFDKWVECLKELGYTTYWQILNATDYGIPQNRERVIAVSILNDDEGYEFPEKQPLKIKLKDLLDPIVEKKYYIKADAVNSRLRSNFQHRKRSIIDEDKTCRTLTAREWKEPTCVKQPKDDSKNLKQVGMLTGERWDKDLDVNRRIYDEDGSAPTVRTLGGDSVIKVAQNTIEFSTEHIVYDDYNGKIRADQDTIGTITGNCGSGTKRNGVKLIENANTLIEVGTLEGGKWDKLYQQSCKVYSEDGVSPTIHTCGGEH